MRTLAIVSIAVTVSLAIVAPAPVVAGVEGPASTDAAQTTEVECTFPFEEEDATGETVTVEDSPESVAALQPSDAQTAVALGAEDELVGAPVGQYTDYLDLDEDIDISEDDDVTPVAERVIEADPDAVIAANVMAEDPIVDQLRDADVTVYVFDTEESLDGVAENVELTGQLIDECDGAESSLTEMDESLDTIGELTDGEAESLAFYAMGDDGYTAGETTFEDEILTTAGVENLGAEVGIEGWDVVSDEVVVDEDPEWIVYGESWGEPPITDGMTDTTAVEEGQFVAVNDQYMSQPGPYVVLAIEEIAETVHGDREPADIGELDEETEDDAQSDADDAQSDADDATDAADADETIPGFGVPAAVVALLASIGLVALRR